MFHDLFLWRSQKIVSLRSMEGPLPVPGRQVPANPLEVAHSERLEVAEEPNKPPETILGLALIDRHRHDVLWRHGRSLACSDETIGLDIFFQFFCCGNSSDRRL